MDVITTMFAGGWAALGLYWLIAAFSMKRAHIPTRELGISAVVVAVFIVLSLLGPNGATDSRRMPGAPASGSSSSLSALGSPYGRAST